MIQINEKYYSWAEDDKIAEKGECGGSLTVLLKFLLAEGKIDAVLAIKKGSDLYDAVPVLINNPDKIIKCAGSMHFGTPNIAKIIEKYLNGARNIKIAAVTKPCDAMAVKELIKREKIDQNNVILFGINCGGTLPPIPMRKKLESRDIDPDSVLKEEISKGKLIFETHGNNMVEIGIDQLENQGSGRRSNCRRCEYNIPKMSDVAFGNWGVIGPHEGKFTFIEIFSEIGVKIVENASKSGILNLKKAPEEGIAVRNKMDKIMINLAKKWQNEDFTNLNGEFISILSYHQNELDKCIKCFGCIEACPICFCNECSLRSEVQEFIDNADIPPSPLFHMERLIHMADSCINCGQCEDVCPVDIPLSKISHEINYRLREIFNYVPGIDDKMPPFPYLFNK